MMDRVQQRGDVNVLRSAMRARIRSEVRAEIERMEIESNGVVQEKQSDLISAIPSPSPLLEEMSNLNINEQGMERAGDSEGNVVEVGLLREVKCERASGGPLMMAWTAMTDGDLWWMMFDAVFVFMVFMWYLSIVDAQWRS